MKFRGGFIILCLKTSFVIVWQQCRGFRRRTRSLLGQPWRLHDHQSVAPLLTSRVSQKALNIALHSANPLLELLLSGKCYKAITKRTWRFRYNLFTQTTMSMNRGRWLSTDWSRLRVCVDDVFVPPTLYHVGWKCLFFLRLSTGKVQRWVWHSRYVQGRDRWEGSQSLSDLKNRITCWITSFSQSLRMAGSALKSQTPADTPVHTAQGRRQGYKTVAVVVPQHGT